MHQVERSGRADLHTGRFQAVADPHSTAVAFLHAALLVEGRYPKGAGHGAAVAADTGRIVVNGQARLRVLADAGAGAGRDAGGVRTVHTRDGNVHVLRISPAAAFLPVKHRAEGADALLRINVVLINWRCSPAD